MDFEISAAYIDTPENTEGKFPTPRAKKKRDLSDKNQTIKRDPTGGGGWVSYVFRLQPTPPKPKGLVRRECRKFLLDPRNFNLILTKF